MKVRVISNGVDTKKFRPLKRELAIEWFESKFGELDTELNIVYLGRLSPEKGVVYLIHSMKYLTGKLFIGGSGPQETELKKVAEKYHDKIQFLGKIKHEDVPLLYNAMDVFVLPSVSMEGFSNSMLEALACGLPVVATPIGAAPEVLCPETGIVVEPQNPKAIARGIESIINLSRRKIHLITKKRYSFDIVAQRMYALYESVLDFKPSKICFASLFSPPYDLSGAGIQVYGLAQALSKYCQVAILCGIGGNEGNNNIKFKNIRVINTRLLSRPSYSLTGSVAILKEKFDIVDGRNWEGGIVAYFAKKNGSRGVMSLRGEGAIGEAMWKRTINRFLIQRLDLITATDRRTASLAEALLDN
jgi:hypothetical protein